MKIATENQLMNLASKYSKISYDATSFVVYAIDANGNRINFAAKVYRDTFHNMTKSNLMKYNGDYTYSKA